MSGGGLTVGDVRAIQRRISVLGGGGLFHPHSPEALKKTTL